MKTEITEPERKLNIAMYQDLYRDDPDAVRGFDRAIYLSEDMWLLPSGDIIE